VGGIGLLVGIFGIALTLIAFGITIWQLIQTRSASEQVRIAVNALKSRVIAFDVVTELAKATAALKESQRHVANSNWLNCIDSMAEARLSVVILSELESSLDSRDRENLSRISTELENASKRIRSSISKGTKMPEPSSVVHAVGEYQVEITKMSMKVERAI
jgi:ATP:corrinoid adenosyltransferase